MTCVQAEQFHHLWVSPGAVAKENRRRYVQIRRGDSRKGLERIGRYVSICGEWAKILHFLSWPRIIVYKNGYKYL